MRSLVTGVFAGLVAVLATLSAASAEPVTVYPVLETDAVPNADDAADDPAIWVNESNPGASLVIGTDKEGGLAIYDLKGKQLSYTPDGEMNNVDVREDVSLGGEQVVLVAASNRTNNSIAVYALDLENSTLKNVAARPLSIEFDVYGFCLYRSSDGNVHAFVNSKLGDVQQWRLFDDGDGKIDAELVAHIQVGTQVEGMVADDARDLLYVGEERVAVWRYPLPFAEDREDLVRYPVDVREPLGNVIEDVEGLTIYEQGNAGYLIASNQGNDEFLIYERGGSNEFLGSFRIAAKDGIDEVTGTDGIAVTSAALPAPFDRGLFVVQDDENDGGAQNFKYVAWKDIRAALNLK